MKHKYLSILLAGFTFFVFQSCGFEEWREPIDHLNLTDTIEEPSLPPDPCNGESFLCYKHYNEVMYPATNQSYNYEFGVREFSLPVQEFPVNRQLRDGIRAISLDVNDSGGELVCFSVLAFFGSESFESILGEVKEFMDENPREVVTIFLNTGVSGSRISEAFTNAGLGGMMHSQNAGEDWPTLIEMIDAGTRIVVFTNGNVDAGDPSWYHDQDDFVYSTQDVVTGTGDLSCGISDGDPSNSLFRLNHYVTQLTVQQNRDAAQQVNAFNNLYNRVDDCWDQNNKMPNFVVVNWYTYGDLFTVVDSFTVAPEKPDPF